VSLGCPIVKEWEDEPKPMHGLVNIHVVGLIWTHSRRRREGKMNGQEERKGVEGLIVSVISI
jgi:hypothetical protein